jgi:hypothetical protein
MVGTYLGFIPITAVRLGRRVATVHGATAHQRLATAHVRAQGAVAQTT